VEAGKAAQLTRGQRPESVKNASVLIEQCLEGVDAARLQTTLMLMPDKVCAVAFAVLGEQRRRSLCALLGETKARRIREEIGLEARRRTSGIVRARILRAFTSYFRSPSRGRKSTSTIWIRPKRTP
jgi:hypothetical protein